VEKREDRRWRTQRHALQQWKSYAEVLGRDRVSVGPGHFRKKHAWGCNCRKRAKSRPRVMSGVCYLGDHREAVLLRNSWLIERRLWLTDPTGSLTSYQFPSR
jgi:hypothetical protein